MNSKNNGVFAGILSISCCVIPLILLVAGLGGSLLTIFLVKYKVYLMTLAVGALALAWVQYLREVRECAARFCAITGGKYRKWMLGANTAVVVFFLIITYTPAGALVGVDFQGADFPGVVSEPRKKLTAAIPPLDPQFASRKPVWERVDETRYERLSLRVEGMS